MLSIMLAFLLTALCLAADLFSPDHPLALPRLRPVHLFHYEQITGVQRRSLDRPSDMEPQSQAQLVWGLQREEDSFTLANMTLRALPDLPIVLLERFDHMTDHVDCKGDDGEMSLSFGSEPAFRKASNAWRYINEHESHKFLVIANHEGCGPADERQPYIITNIQEDPDSLTIYLASHPIELHEVAHNFELHFGEFKPSKSPLARRQNPDRTCYFTGPCPQLIWGDRNRPDGEGWNNKDSPYLFNWNQDDSPLFALLDNKVKISCKECHTSGTFITSGTAVVQNAALVASTVTGNIQKFNSKFVLQIEGAVLKQTSGMIGHEITLFSYPIPGAGFTLGNVASFGATIDVAAGVFSDLGGRFSMDVAFEGDLDDSAMTMDLLGKHPNQIEGATNLNFRGTKWSMRKITRGAKIEGRLGLKASLGFKLGVDGNLGQARAEVLLPLPRITVKLTPVLGRIRKPRGYKLCKRNSRGKRRGTLITGQISTKMIGSFKMNPPASDDLTFWTKELLAELSLNIPLPKICVPFVVSGLVSDNSLPGLGSNNGDEIADSESDPGDEDALIADAGVGDDDSSPDAGDDDSSSEAGDEPPSPDTGVAVADANLDSIDDASAKAAPSTTDLSNDHTGIASNQQPSDPLGINPANGLSGTQSLPGETITASSSGSSLEPGSLPSNTGSGLDQNTNQDSATSQGGGNNNLAVPGGDSGAINQAQTDVNVGADTLSGNNDNGLGASNPSAAPLGAEGTTSPPSGVDPTVQVAQLSPDNKNNELPSNSALGTDSNPFSPPTASKRTLMVRAASWFRSITSSIAHH